MEQIELDRDCLLLTNDQSTTKLGRFHPTQNYIYFMEKQENMEKITLIKNLAIISYFCLSLPTHAQSQYCLDDYKRGRKPLGFEDKMSTVFLARE